MHTQQVHANRQQLIIKAGRQSMQSGQSVQEYWAEAQDLHERINSTGAYSDTLCQALLGLPPDYQQLVQSILEQPLDEQLTFEQILPRLLLREQLLQNTGLAGLPLRVPGGGTASGWGSSARGRDLNSPSRRPGSVSRSSVAFSVVTKPLLFGEWVIDSGCSRHLTPHRELLHDYQPLHEPHHIIVANGGRIEAQGQGVVCFEGVGGTMQLLDVLHVPEADGSLVSMGKATRAGGSVHFTSFGCSINMPGAKHSVRSTQVEQDQFLLDSKPVLVASGFSIAARTCSDPLVLHHRLGHPGAEQPFRQPAVSQPRVTMSAAAPMTAAATVATLKGPTYAAWEWDCTYASILTGYYDAAFGGAETSEEAAPATPAGNNAPTVRVQLSTPSKSAAPEGESSVPARSAPGTLQSPPPVSADLNRRAHAFINLPLDRSRYRLLRETHRTARGLWDALARMHTQELLAARGPVFEQITHLRMTPNRMLTHAYLEAPSRERAEQDDRTRGHRKTSTSLFAWETAWTDLQPLARYHNNNTLPCYPPNAAGGLATVRVRLGTREYLRGTFAGRRLPSTLYRDQTSGAPDSAKRRLDASLACDGALTGITGLLPGQTHVAFTATGSISAAEPTRRNMPLPTLHILSDLKTTEQDMLMWMARKDIEPVTQPHQAKAVHGRQLKDLYYNDVRYRMASYEFSTTVQQAPRLQAAHELDPYLTNISHSREWQVETGRMLMTFKPAPPPPNTQHQTAVRAVITVDASEAGAALDMPATLLLKDFTVARTLQLAVCSMALATAGAPPRAGTPGTAAMYAQTIRQSQPFPVMSALDTAMVEQHDGGPYMVTTFNDRLGHILRTYGILKVEIPGMFTLKLVTAAYTAQIPRYCLAITVPQAVIAEAALGQILELLSGAHARSTAATVLVAKYPGPGTWEQRLSAPVRPLTYSNNLGDIMTAGTSPGTFSITSKQPLGERISTNTHAADSMEAAYLPFFTLEGYPLFLRKATGAILVSFASNQDLANAVAAAAVDMGGILQLGEEQLQVALPEGLMGCKPPRSMEYPGYTTFAIIQEGSEQDNYINTGLYNTPDRNMLILRAIIAASSNTTLIAVPDANKTRSVLVNATHALVGARTATTAECTFQPAVELAGTQRGPTRDQPRANPAPLTGWGSSIELAGQIQAHQVSSLLEQPAAPPPQPQPRRVPPPAHPPTRGRGRGQAAPSRHMGASDRRGDARPRHPSAGNISDFDDMAGGPIHPRRSGSADTQRRVQWQEDIPPAAPAAMPQGGLAAAFGQGLHMEDNNAAIGQDHAPPRSGGTGAGNATMATAGVSTAGNPFPMVRNTYRSIIRPHQTQQTSHTPLAPPSAAAQIYTNYCQHPLPHRSTPEAARLHSPVAQDWGRRDTHPSPGKAKRHQVRSCAHDAMHTYAPHHLYPNVTPPHTPPTMGHGTGTSLVWGHSRALRMPAGIPDPPVGNTQACHMSIAPRHMPRTSTQSTLSTYNMQLNCHGQRRWHWIALRGLPSALAEAWRSLPETIRWLQEIHQVISHIALTSSSQNTQYNLLTSHHRLPAIAEMLIDNNGTLTSNAFGEVQQVNQQAPHTQTRNHPTPPSWPPTARHGASPAQDAQPQYCPWPTTTHTFTPDHPPSLPRRPIPGRNSPRHAARPAPQAGYLMGHSPQRITQVGAQHTKNTTITRANTLAPPMSCPTPSVGNTNHPLIGIGANGAGHTKEVSKLDRNYPEAAHKQRGSHTHTHHASARNQDFCNHTQNIHTATGQHTRPTPYYITATCMTAGHLGGRNGWKQLIAQVGFEPNATAPDSTLAIGREHSR
ncbi:hypothetical protein QJQ45_019865, partial [Haematococcus lacustris]